MTKSFVPNATAAAGFLAECVPLKKFGLEYLHVSPRTAHRLVNEPDGLPIVEYGRTTGPCSHRRGLGQVQMRQRNPIRRGRAA